ncbi:hypothetical protein JVU11DRAFT_1682 [Chiua virens]|nr:hypothetical protein JVU11DRAFT_1682 [Chiua virens]
MVTEDDVDLESLQAQIDTTMSFAHNLVTSWIKPTHLAQFRSSGADATQILEEDLRRPPRLGVGASIPTTSLMIHEASKLRRKLGKKGAKNEGVRELQTQDPPKSDEEHKGRPAKRKVKADPFGPEGGKKKRKADTGASGNPFAANTSNDSASLPKNSGLIAPLLSQGSPFYPPQRIGKEKSRMDPKSQLSSVTEMQVTLVSLPTRTTFSPVSMAPTAIPPSDPFREISVPVPGKTPTSRRNQIHPNSVTIPDKVKPGNIPLLNLDGPPDIRHKAGDTNELNDSKKKRKRRKKKKPRLIAGTGNNAGHVRNNYNSFSSNPK